MALCRAVRRVGRARSSVASHGQLLAGVVLSSNTSKARRTAVCRNAYDLARMAILHDREILERTVRAIADRTRDAYRLVEVARDVE
jgi:hypothetical protein